MTSDADEVADKVLPGVWGWILGWFGEWALSMVQYTDVSLSWATDDAQVRGRGQPPEFTSSHTPLTILCASCRSR